MALALGTRLGAYEVIAAIGAGGMGEVYRAHDPKLKRDVALKILPELLAVDPDRLARFRREAQVLASLNHPNIAAIYGLEEWNGLQALVLELVDGTTLAERIASGPIPVEDALPLARQIAEALEAAHELGIIHRDLKPANINVRPDGTVKVLDFGLAKALEPEAVRGDVAASPTITSPALTQQGMILGTAAYLSPEQIKGRPADKRSDVWAFGAVLYEMLAGRRVFKGDDVADTLAAVLRQPIDLTALPPSTPVAVRRLVARCLDRDVKRRLRDIGEARIALEAEPVGRAEPLPAAPALPPRPLWRRAIPIVLGVLVAAAVAGYSAWIVALRSVPRPAVSRFEFRLPEGQAFVGPTPRAVIALSPDGTHFVYAANTQLFLRSMSSFDARPIPGTAREQGVSDPVFSPDGRSLLFYSTEDSTIRKVAATGGASIVVCRADPPYGISWGPDGITFGQGSKGVMRVSADGGPPEVIFRVSEDEEAHGPQLLPGGRHLLVTIAAGSDPDKWDKARIVLQPLPSGQPRTLVEGGSDGRYLPSGHLIYGSGDTLFAVPFDLQRLERTGPAAAVLEEVRWSGGRTTGTYHYSVSATGSMIYLPAVGNTVQRSPVEIVVTDRKGGIDRLKLPAGRYSSPPRISPDGKRIAFGTDDGKEAMIYTYELSGANSMRRLTFGGNNRFPIWSSDSRRVAFQSDRDGDVAIWQTEIGGAPQRVTKPAAGEAHTPEDWAPHADLLLFSVTKGADVSLWTLSRPDGTAKPFGDVHSAYPSGARFSPDGGWIAYSTRERVGNAIYVQPFPATGTRHQLFVKGANATPHKVGWSPDGTELFYVPRLGEFEAVSVMTKPPFGFGNAVTVPRPFFPGAPNSRTLYDVTPDGKFLGLIPEGYEGFTRAISRIRVVLNWVDEIDARAPRKAQE